MKNKNICQYLALITNKKGDLICNKFIFVCKRGEFMKYVLYYSQEGRQELVNVVKVDENKKQVRFSFNGGLVLHVMKKSLLRYELTTEDQRNDNQSVQEVFNHFDDFVDQFVYRVEHTANHQFEYTKPITKAQKFDKLMINYDTTNVVKAIDFKP